MPVVCSNNGFTSKVDTDVIQAACMKFVKSMKLQFLVFAGLVSLFTIGCQSGTSVTQPKENPVVQSTPSTVVASSDGSSTKSTESATVKSGTFVSGEHPTEGAVGIVTENGKSILEFDEKFKTSEMGPDLVVILHRSDNVIGSTKPPAFPLKEGDYVIIAPLKSFSGAQSYPIPEDINLEDYQSAAIWCRKFNATFGAAKLSS